MNNKQIEKIRLRWFYFLTAFLLFFSSCKDDQKLANEYFVRFKINNNSTVEFNGLSTQTASFQFINGQYTAFITGFDANSGITLQIYDDKSIEETTYSNYGFINGKIKGVVMGYNDENDIRYSQYFPNPDVQITIENITDVSVEGRFSGTLKSDEKGDISISNGEFLVQRLN